MRDSGETRNLGQAVDPVLTPAERDALRIIYQALKEKGYSPVRQIAYYLMSGEPAYITAHGNARSLIVKLDRDAILEEVVRHYFETGLRPTINCG